MAALDGPQDYCAEVAAIYEDSSILGNYVIDLETWQRHFSTDVDQFASAALQASEQEQFVPEQYRDRVIAASPVLHSGETTEIQFTAPLQKGDYPVVCSFPGHWAIMKGTVVVE